MLDRSDPSTPEFWKDVCLIQEEIIDRLESELRRLTKRKARPFIISKRIQCPLCKRFSKSCVAVVNRKILVSKSYAELYRTLMSLGYTPREPYVDEKKPEADPFNRELIDFQIPDSLSPDIGNEEV